MPLKTISLNQSSQANETIFSICIPFYSGFDTISRCLESIQVQVESCKTHNISLEDIDIVITNDNTSLEAREFLEEVSKSFNVRLIHNETTLGVTGNWDAALASGRGKLTSLLHDDDYLNPNCLAEIFIAFNESPNLVMVATNAILDFEDQEKKPRVHVKREKTEILDSNSFFKSLFTQGVPAPSTVFFRAKFLRDLNPYYDHRYVWCPEIDLYKRLAFKFQEGLFQIDHRPLVSRSVGSNQYSKNTPHYRIQDYLTFWEDSLKDIDKIGLDLDLLFSGYVNQIYNRVEKLFLSAFNRNSNEMRQTLGALTHIFSDHRIFKLIVSNPENEKRFFELITTIADNLKMRPIAELISGLGIYQGVQKSCGARLKRCVDQISLAQKKAHATTPWRAFHLDDAYQRADDIFESANFNQPILILGFHHSGTRLLAELLEAIGVFQVTNSPTKEWIHIQWLNMMMLPEWNDSNLAMAFNPGQNLIQLDRSALSFRMALSGYSGHSPWGHKDPRNSFTASAWIEKFPEAKIVNIVRDPCDVLGTLPNAYARYSPEGKAPQEELEFWASVLKAYTTNTHEAMGSVQNSVEVTFEDLCLSPFEILQQITHALDLDCRPEKSDLACFNIRADKIGVHRSWLEDGRLTTKNVNYLNSFFKV